MSLAFDQEILREREQEYLEACRDEQIKQRVKDYKADLGNFCLNEPHDEKKHDCICEVFEIVLKSDSQDKDIWRMKGLINNIMEQQAEHDLGEMD